MGVEFKISREPVQGRPDVVVFHLSGWLDAQSEQQFVDTMQAAKEAGAQYVLLDLRDMDTITSAGIRAIHRAYLLLTPKDEPVKTVRLKLCNAPAPIYQVLSITGILLNVPVYENAEDAVESFAA